MKKQRNEEIRRASACEKKINENSKCFSSRAVFILDYSRLHEGRGRESEGKAEGEGGFPVMTPRRNQNFKKLTL